MTPKVYEQAIGFMRIIDGKNPLDRTSIHPESYDAAKKLLDIMGFSVNDIGSEKLKSSLNIDIDEYSKKLGIDKYTLKDIIDSLASPERDPRDEMPKPILRSDVLKFDDLQEGMELTGTVRNVIDFGAFVDIGVKHDGLVHISEMADRYIKNPSEVVSVGDIVKVKVLSIDREKQKVSLTMKIK